MRRLILGALILSAMLGGAWKANSQPVSVVQGRVVDEAGSPVANQPLAIERQLSWKYGWWPMDVWGTDWGKPIVAVTDSEGFFQVVDLPPGDYKLKALYPGAWEPVEIKGFKLSPGYKKFTFEGKVVVKVPSKME